MAGRTESLEIRLQADEKESFRKAADLDGLDLSSWVRSRLRKAAMRELDEAGQQTPFLQTQKHFA